MLGPLYGTSSDLLMLLWYIQPADVTVDTITWIEKQTRILEVRRASGSHDMCLVPASWCDGAMDERLSML